MTFNKRLTELRKSKNLSQDGLARLLGVSRGAVSMWEIGQRVPDRAMLGRIADLFGVSVDYLLERTGDPRPVDDILRRIGAIPAEEMDQVMLPVYGTIRAGDPLPAYQDLLGYEPAPRGAGDFFLRVQGDSMDAANVPPGSLVLVKKQDWLNPNDIGVFFVRDEDGATIKRYLPQNGLIILVPESKNSQHKPRVYREEDIRILGKVVEVRWRVG
ncbi:MAG: LexA family protein [Bacillota bacterium]